MTPVGSLRQSFPAVSRLVPLLRAGVGLFGSARELVEVGRRPRRGRFPTSSRSVSDLVEVGVEVGVEVRTDLVEVKNRPRRGQNRPRRGQKPTSSMSKPDLDEVGVEVRTDLVEVRTDLDEVKNRPRRGAQ